MNKEINGCRICKSEELVSIVNLGEMALTGVFPKSKEEIVDIEPIELVRCDKCGLVQLKHNYEMSKLYGENYGYRSGLNKSMVEHLKNKVKRILSIVEMEKGDVVIDIGSNDSTLLQAYPKDYDLIGVDPTGVKFKSYYPSHISLIPEFFPSENLKKRIGEKKVKIVTSISMFYDLEDPVNFMREIYNVLDENGVWVLEQSYMPFMLENISYDTLCHEHLEYYALKQIKYMADIVGFKILDVEFNNINGGSFSIMVSKKISKYPEAVELVAKILKDEENKGLLTLEPYRQFEKNIIKHNKELRAFLETAKKDGKKVFGYGASTKGNVILQYCNITEKDIEYVAEVNSDKFGCFTPGTLLPIISEEEAKALKPDFLIVLPWHFKDFIVNKELEYLKQSGCKLVFPLPEIEVV